MVRAAEPPVQDPFDVKSYALRHRYARASLVAWAAAEYVGAVEAQGAIGVSSASRTRETVCCLEPDLA
jgi:hypothetical protein